MDVAAAAAGALAGAAAVTLVWRSAARRGLDAPETPLPPAIDPAERVLGRLPFAAFVVDEGGRVTVFNAAAEELFGVAPARAVGRALIEVIPSVALERMVESVQAGAPRTRDFTFGTGARERSIGVSVQAYEGGVIGIAADRTSSLASERARRAFIGDVSHELRTPLAATKLMVETILQSDEDAEARSLFLPQIAREVERMIRIVEDLLELTRSEAANVQLRTERFDLSDVAASTVNSFAHRADALGIRLELEAPAAVAVDSDRNRLVQVAVNLVDNALRHTPAGGSVVVTVSQEPGSAVLRVRDTGAGIPFLDLNRVFERFYVVDRSRSREHGGTGLGLSIAKQLVEAHGGEISAESEYGRGAVFTMRLPLPRTES